MEISVKEWWHNELAGKKINHVHKGGPGSGSWESPRNPRFAHEGTFNQTKLVDGQRVLSNGKPVPEHISSLKIPLAWINVSISMDPKTALWARGTDAKGRHQSIYNPEFTKYQADKKFARVIEMAKKFDAISKENDSNLLSKDPIKSEAAAVEKLIMATGIRPGSEKDTGAAKQAYGATTLLGKHVVVDGDNVRLEFVGKKGKDLSIPIEDKAVAAMVVERAKAGPDSQLFKIDDGQLRSYTHSLDGGSFKTKDFRTLLGTVTAINKVKEFGDRKPSSEKEYKKMVKEVAIAVSRKLGNTPTIALQSYINPIVFKDWQGYGVGSGKAYGLAAIFKGNK